MKMISIKCLEGLHFTSLPSLSLSITHSLTIQAFHKLDVMATQHTEKLRKLTKQVQEYRKDHDDEAVKRCVEEYDDTLEK